MNYNTIKQNLLKKVKKKQKKSKKKAKIYILFFAFTHVFINCNAKKKYSFNCFRNQLLSFELHISYR